MLNSGGIKLSTCQSLISKIRGCVDAGPGGIPHVTMKILDIFIVLGANCKFIDAFYGEWGDIFKDHVIAAAILDRILHHCTTANIKGDSYRIKDRKRQGLIPQNFSR
jgi:hypothetical protein